MVFMNDPISSFILSGAIDFLINLFISIQFFPVSGRLSPHNLRCIPEDHIKRIIFVVGVPTTPLDPSPKDAFSSSFVA